MLIDPLRQLLRGADGNPPGRKPRAPQLRINSVVLFAQQRALAATALLLPLLALLAGCQKPSTIGELSVGELAVLLRGDHPPVVYDANAAAVRAQYGIIPGARLLSSAGRHGGGAGLPEERARHLVFYCATRWCSAARIAAGRAQAAGYQRVDLLPAGIRGWSDAGLTTTMTP